MKIEYTIEQQKAIEESGQNIIVSAGAGSGKTQVLTERVVYFIKEKGYHLDEFLILTFTNLAAGEMKNRIRESLTNEGLDAAKDVDSATICTFDSYALALVKKYHFLLGLSANVNLIDSNLIEVRKRTILNDIFEEYYAKDDELFCEMIDRFCFKNDDAIRKLILQIYSRAVLANDTDEYLDNFVNHYFGEENVQTIVEDAKKYIKLQVQDLIKKAEELPDVEVSKKDPRSVSEALVFEYEECLNASTFQDVMRVFPYFLTTKKPKAIDSKDYRNLFKKYHDKLREQLKKWPKSFEEIKSLILTNEIYAKKMLEIIKILDMRIKEYKVYYQVYEFADIAKLALKLVKENKEICDAIKNQLKMIMIDEYQDTSYLQEEFISIIANNNVYMVGDVKQSIYRFRNAKCDIFIDKYEKYKETKQGLVIDMNKNFRSRKEVLEDINYIFKHIMTKEYGGANYLKEHLISFGNKTFEENKPNGNLHTEFLVHDQTEKYQIMETEAHLIARDIINKINNKYQVLDKVDGIMQLRDCRYSDFCILMDRGNSFETYAQIFNEYQLPLAIEYDENIASTDLVLVLINLLKLVRALKEQDNLSNYKKEFVSVARSFLYNYSDEEIYHIVMNNKYSDTEIIKVLREALYETSAYPEVEQFKKLIYQLNIYNKCIYSGNLSKNTKYLDTFMELFSGLSKLDYTLSDLIAYLEDIDHYKLKITLTSSGSEMDCIKLMNVHKSKGLEFKIIYYPGLMPKFNLQDLKGDFGISNKYGLILPSMDEQVDNIIKVLNKFNETQEEISERIRLFYVALTRAKEKMIFVLPSSISKQIMKQLSQDEMKVFMERTNYSALALEQKVATLIEAFYHSEISCESFGKLSRQLGIIYPEDFNGDKKYDKVKLYAEYQIGASENTKEEDFEESVEPPTTLPMNLSMYKADSFYSLIEPFLKHRSFNAYSLLLDVQKPVVNVSKTYQPDEKLNIIPIGIQLQRKETRRASKKLKLTASQNDMKFGTKIHQILEMLDFHHPNYQLILEEENQKIVQRFLASSLMNNIQKAKIYKEYQFIDTVNATTGIIDLMLVYDDHIDIIDYKTKNIVDEVYNEQLTIYKQFVKQITNKPINCYIYSLLTGQILEVK